MTATHNEQVVIRLREWADEQQAKAEGEILVVPEHEYRLEDFL